MPRTAWLRIVRLSVLGTACTLGLFGIMLLPDLIRYIPERIRAWWVEALSVFCLIVYAIAANGVGQIRGKTFHRVSQGWLETA